ncbi:MAG: 4-alpha-glucanotransferase [Planctomycetes bacterium]|nr:4-alpha-glucanotransferase [Planctomycetota bacterium]
MASRAPFSLQRRTSGILLHPTSLPGPHGCGDLGAEAHGFVEFLARAGQACWQMLPIGPPGRLPCASPYDSASAFAGSPWLVSLDELGRQGLLTRRELRPAERLPERQVDLSATQAFRSLRLQAACTRFHARGGERRRDYRDFCERNADWLDDYALFMALRRHHGDRAWTDWDPELRQRRPAALRAVRRRLADDIRRQRFEQFAFDRQWRALRTHAQERGIGLIGDLPLFVAHDSCDVWRHPGLFQLDANGRPRRISGYPPDELSAHGQRWGHPQYDWAAHRRTGFRWWVRRFERLFDLFDAVRVDHFLGFTRSWSIPADAADASTGRWVPSPGRALLRTVRSALGKLPLIAEDLGHVTPADVRLRDRFGLLPTRLLQFGFGDDHGRSEHLPHHHGRTTAAYTGNHDTDTWNGWFARLPAGRQAAVRRYTGGDGRTPHLAALRTLLGSPANLVVFPLQDLLGLGSRARMNVPGTELGNWRWRMPTRGLDRHARRLRELTLAFGRGGGD